MDKLKSLILLFFLNSFTPLFCLEIEFTPLTKEIELGKLTEVKCILRYNKECKADLQQPFYLQPFSLIVPNYKLKNTLTHAEQIQANKEIKTITFSIIPLKTGTLNIGAFPVDYYDKLNNKTTVIAPLLQLNILPISHSPQPIFPTLIPLLPHNKNLTHSIGEDEKKYTSKQYLLFEKTKQHSKNLFFLFCFVIFFVFYGKKITHQTKTLFNYLKIKKQKKELLKQLSSSHKKAANLQKDYISKYQLLIKLCQCRKIESSQANILETFSKELNSTQKKDLLLFTSIHGEVCFSSHNISTKTLSLSLQALERLAQSLN
jgi:hypothetical protein